MVSHLYALLTLLWGLIAPSSYTSTNKQEAIIAHKGEHKTIFVHGTLFPGIAQLVHKVDCPLGMVSAQTWGNKYFLGCIPHILNRASSHMFPLEHAYLFGWSGKLDFKARKEAARALYNELRTYQGPLTIIAHSHGCNVALSLGDIAKEYRNQPLVIDRLILLACPVQKATSGYIKSPIFKRVFSLYSSADFTQIGDPQGLYRESYASIEAGEKIPLFSQRIFPPSPNLIQGRIFLNKCSPGHLEFIKKPFLTKLPEVLDLLEHATNYYSNKNFMINVPTAPQQKPYLVAKKSYRSVVELPLPNRYSTLYKVT
jgi:hypothetical protein